MLDSLGPGIALAWVVLASPFFLVPLMLASSVVGASHGTPALGAAFMLAWFGLFVYLLFSGRLWGSFSWWQIAADLMAPRKPDTAKT